MCIAPLTLFAVASASSAQVQRGALVGVVGDTNRFVHKGVAAAVPQVGQEPAKLTLRAGTLHASRLHSATDKTCGTDVVFPSLNHQAHAYR